MTTSKELISSVLLANRSFREDLKRLLNLPSAELLWINSLADGPDGFSAASQSMKLAEHAGIDPQDAIGAVRAAEYVYERARESSTAADEATKELLKIAATLGVQDMAEKAQALHALLTTKQGYEAGRYASNESLAAVPHFRAIEAIWDIRPVFNRETGEVLTTVPALIVNVSWHDLAHNDHSAVFQLTVEEWAELREALEKVERERQAMERYRGPS